MQEKQQKDIWVVYMVKCSDDTLYTGITNNLEARIEKHNKGTGAKYTRGRGPVKVLKSWEFESKSDAAKEEYRIKKMSKSQKIQFLKSKES